MADNPLYDLVTRGESGPQGYDAFNRGTHRETHDGSTRDIPNPIGRVSHEPITMSTLDEIQSRQGLPTNDPTRLGAVGEYQMIRRTLGTAISDLRLLGDARFDSALQDRIFSDSLLRTQTPAAAAYIEGKPSATLEKAQAGLAGTWASFSDPGKPDLTSRYEGPSNHASISLAASAGALDLLRTRYGEAYRDAVARHDANPADTAWAAATAISPEQRARQDHTQGPAAGGPAPTSAEGPATANVATAGQMSVDIARNIWKSIAAAAPTAQPVEQRSIGLRQ